MRAVSVAATPTEQHTGGVHAAALTCAPWDNMHIHPPRASGPCTSLPRALSTPPPLSARRALSCDNVYDARRPTYDGAGADVTRGTATHVRYVARWAGGIAEVLRERELAQQPWYECDVWGQMSRVVVGGRRGAVGTRDELMIPSVPG